MGAQLGKGGILVDPMWSMSYTIEVVTTAACAKLAKKSLKAGTGDFVNGWVHPRQPPPVPRHVCWPNPCGKGGICKEDPNDAKKKSCTCKKGWDKTGRKGANWWDQKVVEAKCDHYGGCGKKKCAANEKCLLKKCLGLHGFGVIAIGTGCGTCIDKESCTNCRKVGSGKWVQDKKGNWM